MAELNLMKSRYCHRNKLDKGATSINSLQNFKTFSKQFLSSTKCNAIYVATYIKYMIAHYINLYCNENLHNYIIYNKLITSVHFSSYEVMIN